MRRMTTAADQDRETLTSQIYAFKASYPDDRRVAALLAEIATLYDTQPQRKRELLNEALTAATTPELRARIEDDLKRLSFLGRPLDIRGVTLGGAPFDLTQCRGKVTLIYFFATWSAPSVVALEEVESVRNTFAKDPVEVIGVSLDSSREALEVTLKSRNITWPVLFDGKSWKSPLVRSLSINAIPTLWLVDCQGNLRTLNARVQTTALVQVLLKGK